MSPLRLRVRATAGCGKTGVAIRFFENAVEAGKRPLLVCFNRPLREKLKSGLPDSGLVQTWYGLCATFLESRGVRLDYRRVRSDPDFWTEVQEQVIEQAIEQEVPEAWKFDCLVIDEAQDFDPEWFQVLDLFLNDPHDVLWLEDPTQNIRQTEPPAESGFIGYSIRDNHRSPYSIARFIRSVVPFEFECANDLPGMGVGVTSYEDPAEQSQLAARIITDLVRRGFSPSDVTLLTMLGHDKSVLSKYEKIGQFTIRRFTGKYDSSGSQIMSAGQINFDSISRFKGQDSYIPSFQTSYYREYFSINTLLHQQLRKPLHQWTQTMLWPVRDVLIQHQPLPEQRMRAVLHRVRPQPPVIPQALPCRTQQGQQSNRQCTEQQHPVPTLRTRYPHRRHPHPESHVLEVAKARLNPPTLGVVAYQRARANLALTGHQAPGLLHLVVLHTHHRAHLHSLASPHPSPTQRARTASLTDPLRRPATLPFASVTMMLPRIRSTYSKHSSCAKY